MPPLFSPDSFEFFARYLFAGYVVIVVRAAFVTGARPKPGELIVEAVILSLIVQLCVSSLRLFPGYPATVSQTDPLFFVEVLLVPALLGALFGFNLSRGWNRSILRRLSLPVTHPSHTGYDFAFANGRKPSFVVITFDDGSVVRGWFGEHSLASSDPSRSDIYLERIYSDGEGVRSGIVSLAGMRSIEFIEEADAQDT